MGRRENAFHRENTFAERTKALPLTPYQLAGMRGSKPCCCAYLSSTVRLFFV